MSHMENPRNQPRKLSAARNNAMHFIVRDRLSEQDLDEWVTAAFGYTKHFKTNPEASLAAYRKELDAMPQEVFGADMSMRSIGGMLLCLGQMIQGANEAQGQVANSEQGKRAIENAYQLVIALHRMSKGIPLNRLGMQTLRQGGEILDAVSDYAREIALVAPWKAPNQEVRDKLRPISRGMPAVDLAFSFMAKEYREHVAPNIPSWTLTGRVA